MVKYRRLLLEVFGISLVLQLFALLTPLFFQVVVDKVLVNGEQSTLMVIGIAFAASSLFEVVLNGLRTYVFSHTTNRIDVELGARLFRHLLGLPLPYFGARRVGDTVARVRELESIRNFLTGQTLTSAIDVLFSGVFLAWYRAYGFETYPVDTPIKEFAMRRLYFLVPDVPIAQAIVDDLLLARVTERHIHVIAREGTPLVDLPEAGLAQRSDLIPAIERGLRYGGATGLLAGLLAISIPGVAVVSY